MKVLAYLWILFWLAAAAREDLKSYTIPNTAVLAIAAAAPWAEGPGARLAAACLPLALAFFMGMGDVKLYSALGLCLGPAALGGIIVSSLLLGGIFAFILLSLKKLNKKDRIAFGPFIAACAALYMVLNLVPG